MSEHFHYIEDMSLTGLNLGGKEFSKHENGLNHMHETGVGDIPNDSKPREIEIGVINRKPLYIVFRLDKLKLWGVDHE
ncbi:hypothetical protein LCGC14_0697330 [marine sediment metagenome]|uniref:Uncharacterized protein n=1 Tax=marine sediment metagenome TaxID=412755 RepID=A0A0F9EPA0_9ZZZZ